MYAKIEPSGSEIRYGRLKLRIDLYIDNSEPHYSECADRPFHSHFIYPELDADDNSIKTEIDNVLNYFYHFYQYCWDNNLKFIDEWKKVPVRSRGVRHTVPKNRDMEVAAKYKNNLDRIVSKLDSFVVTRAYSSKIDLDIGTKGTIDVGSSAVNRASYINLATAVAYRTLIDYNNPSNADGTIDTVQIYMNLGSGAAARAGTFTDNGGGSFTCNDGESLGSLSNGLNTFSGLSIAISTGQYIGADATNLVDGRVDRDTSGGGGLYYVLGQP